MSVHANTANQVNPYEPFINIASGTAGCAMAGALIGPPFGALGGALFGAVQTVIGTLVNYVSEKTIDTQNTAAKTAMLAFGFFASFAASLAALSLAGFSFTAAHVAILLGTTLVVSWAVSVIIVCGIGAVGLTLAASRR